MAPVKFGLFKARSRDQEQPSTENLLQTSSSTDTLATPDSPLASTSRAEEFAMTEMAHLALRDSCDNEIKSEDRSPTRRGSSSSGDGNQNYQQLKNDPSTDGTSTTTVHEEDFDEILYYADVEDSHTTLQIDDDASTSCDANSLQFDQASLAASEDLSVHCGALKKQKKSKSKEEQQLRDFDMWQASNIEVMQNLLSRSGTLDDQIKWEAIATSRGLCTLTDSCACPDCTRAKYLTGVTDGDGGLGAAPLFSAMSVGCSLQ